MSTCNNILIIDDFATMRKILANMLSTLGYQHIQQAESAKSGWELVQQDSFDLVISDYNMPGMTGMELLRNIRQDPQLKSTKFIMLTAETSKELIIESKKLGVNGYILKPFKIEIIQEKLNSLFNAQ